MKKIYLVGILCGLCMGAKAQSYCTPAYEDGFSYYYSMNFFFLPGDAGTYIADSIVSSDVYVDHSASSVSLSPGTSYSANILYSAYYYYYQDQVWIDFNDDGAFDATEAVTPTVGSPSMGTSSQAFTITIPVTATAGTHRMRVREVMTLTTDSSYALDPCNEFDNSTDTSIYYYYGTTADYTVSIATSCTGTPDPGAAIIEAGTSCGTSYGHFVDSGYSATAGLQWQWQSSTDSASWTNVAGATDPVYYGTVYSGTYYRCVVTCAASGLSATTNSVSETLNQISGYIEFPGSIPDSLQCQVWLIRYDSATGVISAIDSVTSCPGGTVSSYYEFNSEPAGNYLVKASLLFGETPGLSGYIPTYATSSPYWDSATVVTHTSGIDSGVNILMQNGIVPSGPGFVSGSVSTGAGKSTSGSVPVEGLMIYLRNASGNVVTYTYTDATGVFSFNNIGTGSYDIYPEGLGYATTPSAFVISASSSTVYGENFFQDAAAHTIRPVTASVQEMSGQPGIQLYPNPASSMLTVKYPDEFSGKAQICITDALGREVYFNEETNKLAYINVSLLAPGIYQLSVKSDKFSDVQKLTIQH